MTARKILVTLFFLAMVIPVFSQEDFQGLFTNYQHYLDFYSMELPSVSNHYQFIEVKTEQSNRKVFVQTFTPQEVKARVVYVHGYRTHSGRQSMIIKYLLERNFEVWVFDLPGHGLSDGIKYSIGSFTEYADVLHAVTQILPKDGLPLDAISHSTGGSAILEYLRQYDDDFDKVILLAPLVLQKAPVTTFLFQKFFMKHIERLEPPSNPNKKKEVSWDPFEANYMPVTWIRAHFTWQVTMLKYPHMQRSMYVIQGKKDQVVYWRENMRFFRRKFKHLKIVFLPKAKHSLLDPSADWKDEVIQKMDEAFLYEFDIH